VDQLTDEHEGMVDGIHFHTLCEQDFEPLQRTWDALLRLRIEPYFGQLKWLNFGGGHHITRADYQRDELVAFLRAVKEDTGCRDLSRAGRGGGARRRDPRRHRARYALERHADWPSPTFRPPATCPT
jgi:hypothetical protein